MLDLFLLDPLLVILPLQGLYLVLKFLNLVLVAAGKLKLGGEVI